MAASSNIRQIAAHLRCRLVGMQSWAVALQQRLGLHLLLADQLFLAAQVL